jgi:hypothetical protein
MTLPARSKVYSPAVNPEPFGAMLMPNGMLPPLSTSFRWIVARG